MSFIYMYVMYLMYKGKGGPALGHQLSNEFFYNDVIRYICIWNVKYLDNVIY
jgi:hypothetical protein